MVSMAAATGVTDSHCPLDLTGSRWKPVRPGPPELAVNAVPFPGSDHRVQEVFGVCVEEYGVIVREQSPSGIYQYVPYPLVVSTIALTFSGFAWSKNAPLLTIRPPPLPQVSMICLT
jgi:hypothetical protein